MGNRLINILLVLASITLAVVLCEVGLRLLGIEYPNFWDYDPVLGSKLRPGSKGYWLQEGGGYVSINSDGLRDREHPIEKPPNTFRIAVLGDSYAEALQVNQEEAFWAVMEKGLQGCDRLGGRRVEVINFGQSGFGTTQELLALRHRAWKYSPDAILLAFCTGNDLLDNSKPLSTQRGSLSDVFPYHSYQDGKLVLNDRAPKEWLEKIIQKTQVTRSKLIIFQEWLKQSSRIFQLLRHSEKAVWSEPLPFHIVSGMYREPTDKLWKEAWNITEDVLLMMRNEIAQKGVQFFMVTVTNAVDVNPDIMIRTKAAHKLGIQDLVYAERRIEKFCRREGIPLLLLGPPFQEYATAKRVYLHGFKKKLGFGGNLGEGHWNQEGHRLAGALLAEWLCGQIK